MTHVPGLPLPGMTLTAAQEAATKACYDELARQIKATRPTQDIFDVSWPADPCVLSWLHSMGVGMTRLFPASSGWRIGVVVSKRNKLREHILLEAGMGLPEFMDCSLPTPVPRGGNMW